MRTAVAAWLVPAYRLLVNVLQSIALQLPDKIAYLFARADLAVEQRLQQRFQVNPQRHGKHRRRIPLQFRHQVIEFVEALLDGAVIARCFGKRHAQTPRQVRAQPYPSYFARVERGLSTRDVSAQTGGEWRFQSSAACIDWCPIRVTNTSLRGAMQMNSFTLTAVGNLARNPELVAKNQTSYAKLCLVGNDYAGKDEEGAAREVVTTLWFVAFGAIGEALARNARKGDQLFIEARVRSNNWIDKQGEKQYDHSFIVEGFRFGAPGKVKREERDARVSATAGA